VARGHPIEDALDACQTVAVFLGPSGIGSWENEEMPLDAFSAGQFETRMARKDEWHAFGWK